MSSQAFHEGAEPRYTTFLRIVEPGQIPDAPDSDALDKFSVYDPAIDLETELTSDDPTQTAICRAVFRAVQGRPQTKQEILAATGATNPDELAYAEAVFESLRGGDHIVPTTDLQAGLKRAWQNPAPHQPRLLSPDETAAARQPYSVKPGTSSYALSSESRYERATTRLFDPEANITMADLSTILTNAYRTDIESKRPTGSPGGIYPVRIHVLNPADRVTDELGAPALPAGKYQYDPHKLSLEQQGDANEVRASRMEYLTNDADAADPALWVVLGVDVKAHAEKYGNASMMFPGICTGTVLQRITDEAEQAGYGTLPLFGIRHAAVDEMLGNDPGIQTVLAVAIGRKAAPTDTAERLHKTANAAALARVSSGVGELIVAAERITPAGLTGLQTGFAAAMATYEQPLTDGTSELANACGTATTPEEAKLKATAEALERLASANVRIDAANTAAGDLDAAWIDPRIAMPLDAEQIRLAGLRTFDPDQPQNWTAGTLVNGGDKVYAPSSLIYYPYTDREGVLVDGTSSGIAAHFDRDEAARRALFELLERDALMRTWITQASPRNVTAAVQSPDLLGRMAEIRAHGKQVDVLDIAPDSGVPTYLVTIRSDVFPHFSAGASANLDPNQAIGKALDEATLGAVSWALAERELREKAAEKEAQGYFDVESHGMLYAADPEMAATLGWLFEGEQGTLPTADAVTSYEALVARYNPAVFELDNVIPGNELRVVRVIASDLVPIMFGETGVPYRHHTLPEGTAAPDVPHFFN